MVPVSFSLVAFVAFVAFTSRCHIDGKSTLLPSEAACDRWVSHQNGTTALGSP